MTVNIHPTVTDAEIREKVRRSKSLFDQLTEASYMGAGFRLVLVENDEAMKAAQTLVDALIDGKVKLSTPDYKSERTWYIMDAKGKAVYWADDTARITTVCAQGGFTNDEGHCETLPEGCTLYYLTTDEFVHFHERF